MDDVKTNKKNIIVKVLIILIFIILAILVAQTHEPWSDEAQSFLIARDNSLKEIIYYSKFEGTLPLWFIIIKVFILLGGKYETLYILPILFSAIGLYIFEFKVKAPKIIKILLPFTYFIFYQYTIVARSYCLIFPCLMAICSIYKEREKKPIIYFICMFILMSVCSYTLVIAGSFYLIDVLAFLKKLKEKQIFNKEKKKIKDIIDIVKNEKKAILFLIIIFLELLFSFIMLLPDKNCEFEGEGKTLWYVIYHATIGASVVINKQEYIFVTLLFFLTIILSLSQEEDKWNILKFSAILFIPLVLENVLLHCQMWHIGIVTIMIFTIFILNETINTNKMIKLLLIVICIIQISWTCISVQYDINNNYSGSKDVANFLKNNNYEEKVIYGLGFDITAILPYFDYNIFRNQNSEKSFWFWSKDSGYIQNAEEINNDGDIYVIQEYCKNNYLSLINRLKELGYIQYDFPGKMYTKNFIYENKGYLVFTRDKSVMVKNDINESNKYLSEKVNKENKVYYKSIEDFIAKNSDYIIIMIGLIAFAFYTVHIKLIMKSEINGNTNQKPDIDDIEK